MNEQNVPLIRTNPAVANLNRVSGFDPVKLLREALAGKAKSSDEFPRFTLRYKKLWFRLACPQGRIKLTALRITEQMAIIEAKVYLNKDDPEPVANFTAERTAQNTPGGLYIQAAQYEAQDNALSDAGFGIQLCDVCQAMGEEAYSAITPAGVAAETETPSPAAQEPAAQGSEKKDTAEPARAGRVCQQTEAPPQAATAPAQAAAKPERSVEPAVPAAATVQEPEAVISPEPVAPAAPVAHEEERPAEQTMEPAEQAMPSVEAAAAPRQEAAVVDNGPAQAPAEEGAAHTGAVYLPSMSVDEIASRMTLEEARSFIADVGICRGQTLAQIADRRPASLRWYLMGCAEASNILKAGAKLVLDSLTLPKTA